MSNRDEGIKLNKKNLVNNYNSLFYMMSGELNNNKMPIKERILLLNTILRDENGLKRLLEKSDNKSYSFLYYLLKKISNEKLKNIITNSQKNTGKKNLLEGIESEANELIEIINKKEKEREEERKEKEKLKKLKERKAKIEEWKTYILEYIENEKNNDYINSKEKLSDDADYKKIDITKKLANDVINYIVLKKEVIIEKENSIDTLIPIQKSTTIYYLLYKDFNIYTMKTVLCGSNYSPNSPIKPPILLDNEIGSDHFTLLSKLYNDLNPKPQPGGKPTTVPVYKLNGEKVSLLINKKKVHRSVYVKGNSKAKYCKINKEFVLLSKFKNKII
jgi:hypothetical protein